MFDFEKLDVYKVVKDLNTKTYNFVLHAENVDPYYKDEWKKASLSVVQHLAEGVGRTTMDDKRQYITLSRAEVFKCVSLLQSIHDLNFIVDDEYEAFYNDYETASKMLLGMFRSFK